MKGMMFLIKSSSNGFPQPPKPPVRPPPPPPPPKPPPAVLVVALPLGSTTIIGSIFLSAIRLSRTTSATPALSALTGRSGRRAFALGRGFRGAEIAYLASEFDFVG